MSVASEPGDSPTQAWLDPAALRANFGEVRRLSGGDAGEGWSRSEAERAVIGEMVAATPVPL